MTLRALLTAASITVVLGCADPATSQTLPGYQSNTDAVHAQFRAYALEEFHNTLRPWTAAVRASDVDAALEYYADDAFVYLNGAARGTAEIRAQLAAWLAGIDDVQLGLSDFAASGKISYASMHLVIKGGPSEAGTAGTMVFVLMRHGRDWLIRSQTVVMD